MRKATLIQSLRLVPEVAVANHRETGKAKTNMGNPDHRSAGLSGRRPAVDKAAKGVCAIFALACLGMVATAAPPTPEEYVAKVGPEAKIVPPGELRIDGRKVECGKRPTVWDSKLDDYGAAYPGFLILNPKLFARVSMPVKLWIHAHECGHQFRGPDEETADCFAVQRGRRAGWLTPEGLEEVCKFISPAKGDSMHFSGSNRCEAMRRCYADPTVR